jgi:hypothetical protein
MKFGTKLPKDPAGYVLRYFWPKVKRVFAKVNFLRDALALYFCARDPKTPPRAKAIAFAALAYPKSAATLCSATVCSAEIPGCKEAAQAIQSSP